ncbi:MAG: aminoacyl-tRNA hydrolase [Burkholderiales bacterium]|nr:aminoacyl-tRNA hydrolase [Burkholderiales bacterium]
MKLVVGLGNPGREYEHTRHNAGFWWLALLATEERVTLKHEARFHGAVARVVHAQGECWLLQPDTFMNLSGRSVAALARFYKIESEQILIVHDELDLPPGAAKLKKGGGVSGHNGLKDISAQLGTRDFWRLRLGIGHPGESSAVVGFVLNPPRREEAGLIAEAMANSLAVWPLLRDGHTQAAMLKLHTGAKTSGNA